MAALYAGFSKEAAVFNATLAAFKSYFERVLSLRGAALLPLTELREALWAPNRDDLFVGGTVDHLSKRVLLYRGNLDAVAVPFSWFHARPGGPAPDFLQTSAHRLRANRGPGLL